MQRVNGVVRTVFGLGLTFLSIFLLFGYAQAETIQPGTISGTVHFSGEKTGTIYVGAFNNPEFFGEPAGAAPIPLDAASPNDIPYTMEIPPGTYYVGAFLDLPGGLTPGEPDANEPGTFFGPAELGPEPVMVSDVPPFPAGIDLVLSYNAPLPDFFLNLSPIDEFGEMVITTQASNPGGAVMIELIADLNSDGQSAGDPVIIYFTTALYDDGPSTNWTWEDDFDFDPLSIRSSWWPEEELPGGSFILRAINEVGQTAEAPFDLLPLPAGEYQVSGMVTDGADGPGVPGVLIYVSGGDIWNSATAISHYDGSYSLSVNSAGSYYLNAEKEGFIYHYTNYDESLIITATSPSLQHDVPLDRGATVVNGRVFRASNGEGLSGFTVWAWADHSGNPVGEMWDSNDVTDSAGNFSLPAYPGVTGISVETPYGFFGANWLRVDVPAEGLYVDIPMAREINRVYGVVNVAVEDTGGTTLLIPVPNAGISATFQPANPQGGEILQTVGPAAPGLSTQTSSSTDGSYEIWVDGGQWEFSLLFENSYSFTWLWNWQQQSYDGTRYMVPPPPVWRQFPDNPATEAQIDFTATLATHAVTGRVTEPGEWPISYARVRAWSDNNVTGNYLETTVLTDSNGEFILPLIEGVWHIEVWAEGYHPLPFSPVADLSGLPAQIDSTGTAILAQELDSYPLVLEPAIPLFEIAGRVTEADGLTPIGGVRVQANNYWDWSWGGSAFTDADGNYTITGLPEGPYRVWTSSPPETYWLDEFYVDATRSWEAAEVWVPTDPAPSIDFALEAGARVEGLVYVRDVTGNLVPASDVWIKAFTDSLDGTYQEYVMPEWNIRPENAGRYLVKLPPGEWTIQAAPFQPGPLANYAPAQVFISIVSANTDLQAPDIILELGNSISGRVVNELGEGIPDVPVSFNDDWGFWTEVRTDANGNYFLQGIPPESFGWIQARPDIVSGYAWGPEIPVYNASGPPLQGLDLVVKTGVKVIGYTVGPYTVSPTEAPIPYQEIWYGSRETDGWMMTDADGYFEFRLPVGTHWINYEGFDQDGGFTPNYAALPIEITVTEADLALSNLGPYYLVLYSQTEGGAISGALTAAATPASGGHFIVVAFPAGTVFNPANGYGLSPVQVTGFFDVDGSFTLSPLPLDTNYDVYFGLFREDGQESFVSLDARYDVPLGTTDLSFAYDVQGITVLGSVTDGYRSVPGAQVYIMPAPDNPNAGTGFGFTEALPDGSFTIDEMAPGDYIAQATHPLYFDSQTLLISLVAGQPTFILPEPLVLQSMKTDPVILMADVWADNSPAGISYVIWARVEDPDGLIPDTIASVVAQGPGVESYTLTFDPNFHVFSTIVDVAPSAGVYTFTATDLDGNSGSLIAEFQGPPDVALDVIVLVEPKNGSMVNIFPVFSWQEVAGSLGYRIRVSDASGMLLFTSPIKPDTFFNKVPAGILQPGQSYQWRVEAFDAPSIPEANSRSRSAWATITTETTPQVPVITMADAWGVNTQAGFNHRLWARVSDPNGFLPDNTQVAVAGPNQLGWTLTDFQPYLGVFSREVITPLPAGAYIFEVTDAEGLTAGFVANFRMSTTLPIATGLTPAVDAVVSMNPQFSWQPVDGALAYRVRIAMETTGSLGKEIFFTSPLLVDSFFDVFFEMSPIWQPGKEYFWRVDAHDAADIPGTNSISSTSWVRIITEGPPVIALPGDLNGNGVVDLADAVIALQIMVGMHPQMVQNLLQDIDVNGDYRIGIQEALFALQAAAGLRSSVPLP